MGIFFWLMYIIFFELLISDSELFFFFNLKYLAQYLWCR